MKRKRVVFARLEAVADPDDGMQTVYTGCVNGKNERTTTVISMKAIEIAEHSLKLADALAEAVRAQHQYVDLERLGVACEICKALAAFRAARGKSQ